MRIALKIVLIIASLAGLACSIVLFAMQLPNSPLLARLCTPSARFDCNAALSSRWATIWPFSTSTWGVIYFVALLSWFCFVGLPNRRGRHWHLVPTLLCGGGLAISIWLTLTMAMQLGTFCPWCLAAHGANVIIFVACIAGWWTLRVSKTALTEGIVAALPTQSMRPRPIQVVAAGVLPLLTLLGAGVLTIYRLELQFESAKRGYLKAVNSADYILYQLSLTPRVEIPLGIDPTILGDPAAPHTIVLFSDFQCPWCRQLDRFLREWLTRHPHEFRAVFKHFPLNADCNPSVPQGPGQHEYACTAARMFESARQLSGNDKAVEYGSLLFEHAAELSLNPYERLAKQIGVPAKGVSLKEVDARIQGDITLAQKLGVNSSGVIFLDGRKLPAWQIIQVNDTSTVDMPATLAMWEKLRGEIGLGAVSSAPARSH